VTLLAVSVFAVQPAGMRGQQQPVSQAAQVRTHLTPRPPAHIDPKAQALLDRTIQALGGTAFLNFKTMTSEGRAFSISDGVTSGFVFYKSAMEFPDKRRLAYGFGKNKPIILINNGDKGWEVDRYGLEEQRDKQIKNWMLANRYTLENLLRVRLREPGALVLTGGQDFIDNLPANILDIYDARHVEVKVYINSLTGLPIRVIYRIQDPESLDWNVYSDSYADYRVIEGVVTSMHITRYVNDERVAETIRTSVKHDETYPKGYFLPGG
jgi:hypothetical protein